MGKPRTSSKNKQHGDASLARLKTSRTPASLCPMYLFKSDGPFIVINRKPAPFTAACASKVLPHPGGP